MILALLGACQPGAFPGAGCDPSRPDGPRAQEACREVLLGSDGLASGFHLSNAHFTGLLRHPTAPVSAIGVSGGTLVDAAPWDGQDGLLEAIPLVADGWLEIDDFALLDDGFRVSGVVRDLPDRPSTDWGAFREVTWRIDPDRPRLSVEGADGLYVLPGAMDVLTGTQLSNQDTALGLAGTLEDLGGAVRSDVPELWIAPATDPFLGRGVSRAVGRSEEGSHIEVFAGALRIARIPVVDGAYDFAVPSEATGLRAVNHAAIPGDVQFLDADRLEPGPAGGFSLSFVWSGTAFGTHVSWEGPEGPASIDLPPEGGIVPIGPDPTTVTVTSRPDRHPITFEATPGSTTIHALTRAFPVGDRVFVAPSWPSARSRTFRQSNDVALDAAVAAGLSWVVMTPEDAVGPPLSSPPLLVEPGLLVSHLDIVSWPFASRVRQAGWGAPDVRDLDDPDVLAALGSRSIVPLPFLDRIGPPFAADPPPSGVWLTRPEPDLADLAPWWAWLDAGVWLPPFGDRVWVDVADPEVLGSADVQQALFRGNSCVTSGPLLELEVAGIGSGELVETTGPHTAAITVGAASPADRVVLVGPGGVLAEWSEAHGRLEAPVEDTPWWVAIAWWRDDWAVTAPVLSGSSEVVPPR